MCVDPVLLVLAVTNGLISVMSSEDLILNAMLVTQSYFVQLASMRKGKNYYMAKLWSTLAVERLLPLCHYELLGMD